nr:hypothetical protein BgiMline_015052 [Biomphalaria glabrata]
MDKLTRNNRMPKFTIVLKQKGPKVQNSRGKRCPNPPSLQYSPTGNEYHAKEDVLRKRKMKDTRRKPRKRDAKDKIASGIPCKIKETDVNYELNPLKQGIVDIKLENSTQPKTLASFECKHYPGHVGFVEVTDFCTNHLPSAYQHKEMVELIETLAKLTVKIEVKTVMEEMNSSSEIVLGSGKVDEVFFRTQKDGSCKCVCETCRTKKRERWGEIRILTSAQFAYNDSDAKEINCIFFYDDESRKDQCKYLSGDNIVVLNKEKDICMFMCVTCDIDFLKTLDTLLDTFVANWRAAFDKYVSTVRWEETKLCVIVSHPHGCIKHVSIGKFLGNEEHMKRIRYDTPTCPGSIGAFVLVPDFDVQDELVLHN